ncbi:MAG: chorismate mutase [Firmicutes bacterium]|nr:chorismate mutase [Bacillota bacterium]
MDSLDKLREDIDLIDKELIKLFEKRIEKVYEIAEYKKENKMPIFDENREEEVIKRNIKDKEKSKQVIIKDFLKFIMDTSKDIQKNKNNVK